MTRLLIDLICFVVFLFAVFVIAVCFVLSWLGHSIWEAFDVDMDGVVGRGQA